MSWRFVAEILLSLRFSSIVNHKLLVSVSRIFSEMLINNVCKSERGDADDDFQVYGSIVKRGKGDLYCKQHNSDDRYFDGHDEFWLEIFKK